MTNDRSQAAEQLLTYLAYGKTPREALAHFLVEDENIPVEVVNTVAWTGSVPNPAKISDVYRPPREYWNEVLEEIKSDIAALEHAMEVEAVSDFLDEDLNAIFDEVFDGGE